MQFQVIVCLNEKCGAVLMIGVLMKKLVNFDVQYIVGGFF
jgi:hypothetical protein